MPVEGVDKEGAAAISEAMEANSTLLYLNIRLNDFNVQKPILGMLREAKERSDANRASPLELKLLWMREGSWKAGRCARLS